MPLVAKCISRGSFSQFGYSEYVAGVDSIDTDLFFSTNNGKGTQALINIFGAIPNLAIRIQHSRINTYIGYFPDEGICSCLPDIGGQRTGIKRIEQFIAILALSDHRCGIHWRWK